MGDGQRGVRGRGVGVRFQVPGVRVRGSVDRAYAGHVNSKR